MGAEFRGRLGRQADDLEGSLQTGNIAAASLRGAGEQQAGTGCHGHSKKSFHGSISFSAGELFVPGNHEGAFAKKKL
ncbi:MAG TPA: hypothetical protein VKB88_41535 [Bryobacteraceae bacterium]|nr:hypothetical protein [Bryobacteraceae bacterium]